jgi:hypothetical protein
VLHRDFVPTPAQIINTPVSKLLDRFFSQKYPFGGVLRYVWHFAILEVKTEEANFSQRLLLIYQTTRCHGSNQNAAARVVVAVENPDTTLTTLTGQTK